MLQCNCESRVCVQKSKAETDVFKGQMAQLETIIAADKEEKGREVEALENQLQQKNKVGVF